MSLPARSQFNEERRVRSSKAAVPFLAAALGFTPLPSDGGKADPQMETVGDFFAIMAADSPPTIADFNRLFGPHNEDEWTLQLRFEGMRDPLRAKPSDDIVRSVNKRLLSPTKHPSLFLCFLRRQPEMRSLEWHVVKRGQPNAEEGERLIKVRVGATLLTFGFPIGERYIGRLLGDERTKTSVESMLPLCRRADCCQ